MTKPKGYKQYIPRKAKSGKTAKSKAYIPKVPTSKYQNTGILQRCARKLVYNIPYTVGNGVNAVNNKLFSMNDPRVPLDAGGGNQARGFALYSPMYTKYIVHAVSVKLNCLTTSTNNTCLWYIGSYPHGSAAATTSADIITNTMYKKATVRSQPGSTVLKRFMRCATTESVSKKEYSDEPNYQALVTASPVFEPKIVLGMTHTDTTTAVPSNFSYYGSITYYVEFFAPKLIDAVAN